MKIALPDINVLMAMLDDLHVHHPIARNWFSSTGRHGWASCPLTENGVLRILSQNAQRSERRTPASVANSLLALMAETEHTFWPDDISLLTSEHVDHRALLAHRQLTDIYLLALAKQRGGYLVTFDRSVAIDAVQDGHDCLLVLDPPRAS